MCSTIDLCVLCLRYNKTRKSILSKDSNEIVFEEKCKFIFNENVNIIPEVSYICLDCLKNLNYVYYFKHMCLRNIKTFNNYVDTLETKKYLKVTLTDLQYQKEIELVCNSESANVISLPKEEVPVKEEIADKCMLQDRNFLEGEEALNENEEFSTPEKPENLNENIHCSSSLNEEHHFIEHFLNRVKKETEFNLIPEEIKIKDECLFQETDSDSEDTSISNNKFVGGDISSNKLLNEGTNKPDNFKDELDSEHSTADDNKKMSKHCNSASEDGQNRRTDQNVNNAKRHKCDKCHKAFNYPSHLKRHSNTHIEERPFKCTICEKTLTTVKSLTIHNRIHTGEKPYECDICNKKFTTNTQLIVHKRYHNNERPFKCSVCEMAFTKDCLSQHMRIHTGEKPFKCELCQYKCAYASSLKKHMRIHTGEKPFQCQVCQYNFAHSSSLKEHMRIHTGEKPFQCQLCQYKCAQSSSLKTHMRIHTREKIFKCQVCQYKCAKTGDLKKHMRIHTGEKLFACKHCQKLFINDSNLKRHMQTHR